MIFKQRKLPELVLRLTSFSRDGIMMRWKESKASKSVQETAARWSPLRLNPGGTRRKTNLPQMNLLGYEGKLEFLSRYYLQTEREKCLHVS